MSMPVVWNVIIPGITASAAATLVLQITGDATVATVAAGVGAVAGTLLQDRDDTQYLKAHRASLTRKSSETARRPASAAAQVPDSEDMPPGLGRALLETLPIGILLISTGRSVLYINAHARGIFGRVGATSMPLEALRAPRLQELVDEVRQTRGPAVVEFTLQRGPTLHLAAHAVALAETLGVDTGADAPDVLVALEDRTQSQQTDELHRDFVANASHELKTPLATVSALTETLLGHGREDTAAQARFLPMIAEQTERMKNLIEDLLSLNRIELNERRRPSEPQPVARIVWEVAETLRPIAETQGSRIVCPAPQIDAAAPGPLVAGTREELAQVFVNLIENALRYGRRPEPASPDQDPWQVADDAGNGGLAARGAAAQGCEVRVLVLSGTGPRRGMVGIAVEDDGPGIAREHLPRLTERFYRVSVARSRESGGTGLGLAIVKHILNRHRGQLEIESTPGAGSRFTVWLPQLDDRGQDGPLVDAFPNLA